METINNQSVKDVLGNGQVGNNFFVNNSEFEKYKTQIDEMKQKNTNLTERIENLSEIALNKKSYIRFYVLISIISIIISLIAICTSLKSFSISNEAYVGWSIAILSTIIVVLMGWQIFNIIELKGYKESVSERIEDKVKTLHRTIDNFENSTTSRFESFNSLFIKCFTDDDDNKDVLNEINNRLNKVEQLISKQ